MSKEEDQPFIKLEKSDLKGNASKLFHIPGHEDMVIRKSFVDVPDMVADKMNVHEKAEYLRHKAIEFKKIIARLGIRTAKTDYVIGTDPATGNPALFGATERIDGENLKEMKFLDKETSVLIDEIYAKIISDLLNSYKKNGLFWCDMKNTQMIFGKTEKDKNPDIYLIDVDPHIIDWNVIEMDGKEPAFWEILAWLLSEIEDMERKVGEKGFRFKKSREALEKVKTEIFNMA
jgi:hypothetical protein